VCTAVGTYLAASGFQQGLVLSEVNGRWTSGTTPLPSDADGVVALDGVSCAAIGSCTAVGSYDEDGAPLGLFLTEAGGTWLAARPPRAALFNGLYAVSCPVPTECISVGVYLDATLAQQGVVLTGHASRLAAASVPLPTGDKSDPGPGLGVTLNSASCNGGRCVIVGTYVGSASSEHGLVVVAHPFPS